MKALADRRSTWTTALPLLICGVFLYGPIAVLVAMSFNDGGSAYTWSGFSFRWYGELIQDQDLIDALVNSLIVAAGATVIATVLGTLLAIGLARHTRSALLEAASTAPAILPDLLLAVGLLSLFVLFSFPMGLLTILLAHAAFGTAFVVAVVRARLRTHDISQEEASRDLGASRAYTLIHVTLPAIAPAVIAGALLCFTLSLDEFVIAYFTSGPTTQTLPIAIYSRVRTGVTPEINALATLLILVTIAAFVVGARLLRQSEEDS